MSKTMDELMAAFKTGFRDRLQGPGIRPEGDIAIRAGMAAVVRAVRDAAARSEYPLRMLNEILGDAGDEAAGGSSSNADKATEAGGARCATTSASAPATTHCPVCNGKGWDRFDSPCPPCEATGRVPATDPAPDHNWFEYKPNLITCRACGIVRRADGKNKPCKGVVRVGPRAADPAPAVCVWTPQDEGPAHEIWETGCGTMYERAKSTGWCSKCKAPIKFTEAK